MYEYENQVELCGMKLFKNYVDFWINLWIWLLKMNNLERIIFCFVSYIRCMFLYFINIKDKYVFIKFDNKFVLFFFIVFE